jgi:hypothetical protein
MGPNNPRIAFCETLVACATSVTAQGEGESAEAFGPGAHGQRPAPTLSARPFAERPLWIYSATELPLSVASM